MSVDIGAISSWPGGRPRCCSPRSRQWWRRDMDPEKLTPEQALREIVGNVPHPAVIIAELETAYGYTIVPIAERDAGRALYEAVRHDWGNLEAVKAYKEVLDE